VNFRYSESAKLLLACSVCMHTYATSTKFHFCDVQSRNTQHHHKYFTDTKQQLAVRCPQVHYTYIEHKQMIM